MTQALKDGNTVLTSCDPDMACFIEKEFEADDKQLHVVLSFLEEELEKRGAGRKEMMGLSLALEEAFVNVAHYAYEGKEPGKVWISLAFEGDDISITLKGTLVASSVPSAMACFLAAFSSSVSLGILNAADTRLNASVSSSIAFAKAS